MVTLSVSKRPGADATELGRRLDERLQLMGEVVLPEAVDDRVTRNYGETAREKVDTLKEHLGMAVIAVIGNIVTLWSWFAVNELVFLNRPWRCCS